MGNYNLLYQFMMEAQLTLACCLLLILLCIWDMLIYCFSIIAGIRIAIEVRLRLL